MPKKLPRNWWKLLRSPPKAKSFLFDYQRVMVRQLTLDEFKSKLDKVLKPLGFAAVSCEYDLRNYLIHVYMRHVFPAKREYVQEWKKPNFKAIDRDTPITIDDLPKIIVIDPESWQCRFDIAEEEFAFQNYKFLLQQCCHYAVREFTSFQLSKV